MYLKLEEILTLLDYLLDNIYIKYRGQLYKQVIGVPMGTDCAPDLANLFLFSYEYRYMMGLINSKSHELQLFKYIYRYIDDLLVLNDRGHFDRIYSYIYPDVLELNSTGENSNHSAAYLDMTISSSDSKFTHKLYDKRDDFGFKVISMPNLASNIPINPAYSTFYSQIVRYYKANNSYVYFVDNVNSLMSKLCKQNFDRRILQYYLIKFLKTYQSKLISKFVTHISPASFGI